MFQNVLVSVQRRLLWLRYDPGQGLSECLRLGMLALLTTTFELPGRRIPYASLSAQYRASCLAIMVTPATRMLSTWLLLVGAMSVLDPGELWLRTMWSKTATPQERWEEQRQQLRSIIWVNAVHEDQGRRVYMALLRSHTSHS